MREHQRDDSDEIVLVDGTGSAARVQFVSGSTEWPDDLGDIVAGGELDESRDPTSDHVARGTFADDRSAWDEIRSLPTLEDAPLTADEIRAEPRFEPADHVPVRDAVRVGSVVQRSSDAPLPYVLAPRRRGRLFAFFRFIFMAISVLILMVGLALLTWALLSPPQPATPEVTRLDAAGVGR